MEHKIQDVKILKIYHNSTNKQGEKYMSKKGQPFTKVDILIDQDTINSSDFEGKITYFDYFGNAKDWKEGDLITGTVSESETMDKTYYNLTLPPRKQAFEGDIKQLQEDVEKLKKAVFGEKEGVQEALDFSKELLSEDESEDLDLPF